MNLDFVILKTLITNKKHALDFSNECDAKLFSPEVWNFANLVVGYVKTYKELPTLRVIIEKLGKGNNDKLIENTKKIWNQLDIIQYDDKEYKHDLDKLKKRFAEKQIVNLKEKLNSIESEPINIDKALAEIRKSVQNIVEIETHKTYDVKNVKDYLSIFVDKFKAQRENTNFDIGLKTGYSFFDFATNGIKPADLVLIAGESGFGKSLFLNNIAVQVWTQSNYVNNLENFSTGKNIIYFSLEMPYEDCFNRFLSRLSGVPTRLLENPRLVNKEDFSKIKKALDFISKYPYNFKIVDISNACADDLENILTDCNEDFDAIFIDYLGIMRPNKDNDEQDWLKQGIVAYEVRAIGRKMGKPIFSAVQLNRKSANKDSSENIGLSRLARSSTIATHATHVIQIENRPQEENYPDFIYHFIKNRKGPKGKGILYKNLSCATLTDIDKNENIDEDQINNLFQDYGDISEELEELEL